MIERTENGTTYIVIGNDHWRVTPTGLVRVPVLAQPWYVRLWRWLRGLR